MQDLPALKKALEEDYEIYYHDEAYFTTVFKYSQNIRTQR